MSAVDGIQGLVAKYLASPQGKEAIQSFLSSPKGKEVIDAYLSTSEGQQMAQMLLLRALDGLAIPDTIKDQIRAALAQSKS